MRTTDGWIERHQNTNVNYASSIGGGCVDTVTVGRVALLSIHPEYANAIFEGRKTVEFRKRPISHDVTHVIVYATAPISALVGAFSVSGQDTTSPRRLWERYKQVAGISRGKFFDYYTGRNVGTGIQIGDVLEAREILTLNDGLGFARPPQSYQYVPVDAAYAALASMGHGN